jgi:hypothetical protein
MTQFDSGMTEKRRNLILALADGCPEAFPFIYQIEKAKRREEVYSYLVRQRITGRRFISFFEERKFSLLQVLADCLSAIDRKKKEAIIAGVDL